MYDQLFSKQWVLDRCFEVESIFIPLIIVISILILSLLIPRLIKQKKSIVPAIILVPIFTLIGCVFLALFFPGCRTVGPLWHGVDSALKLDRQIRRECLKNNCPKSEVELSKLDPNLYQKIKDEAYFKYNFNYRSNEYDWYVRTSKYFVGIMKNDVFSLYKIPNFFPVKHWSKTVVPDLEKGEILPF